jgi:NADH-quinone oxidoreductase subunit A
MNEKILLVPPAAFSIIFLVTTALSMILALCASRKRKESSEATKEYACGEDFNDHLIQPDYSQFFPFAFFFTILHVVALVIATIPTETIETFAIAVMYIFGAILGLFILLRK